MSIHGHCIMNRFGHVWAGLDKSEQVGSTIFSSTVSRTLSKFGPSPKPVCSFLTVPHSKLYDTPKWWKSALSRFNWRKV